MTWETSVAEIGGLKWHIRKDSTDWNTVNACAIGAEDEYEVAGEDLLYKKVYDLGAHIGGFGVSCAEKGAIPVLVEPVPDNARMIRMNRELNGFTEGDVVEAAVGANIVRWDFDGDEFARAHAFIGNSFRDWAPEEVRAHEQREVREVTLTELAAEYGAPDIIKIDCEGGEWSALADPVARECPLIVGEWHPVPDYQAGDTKTIDDLCDLLLQTHFVQTMGPLGGPGGFRAMHRAHHDRPAHPRNWTLAGG